MNYISYKSVEELPAEANTPRCKNLSSEKVLKHKDINITASCFGVNFRTVYLLQIHVGPQFLKFIFEQGVDRKYIQTS